MRMIFAAAAFVVLSGCASGTIHTLSESRYGCTATGSFFDFSADNAVETCRQEIEKFCQRNDAPAVIGRITSEPSGPARYATADLSFQCISAKDAELKQKQIDDIKSQQMKANIQNAKATCQQEFGFAPNTPEYGNCLLQLQQQNAEDERAKTLRIANDERAEAAFAQQRRETASKDFMKAMEMINDNTNKNLDRLSNGSRKRISCTSSSIGSSVQTDCY